MNANYSKLLTKITGIVGLTGVSLLTTLPIHAEEIRNTEQKNEIFLAQSMDNGILNPRPSIFNEPPYNRGERPSVTPTPATQPMEKPTQATETQNVLEVAKSAGSFTILVKALEAAGLTEVLGGDGPFTVFAPTDQAFAKLPQDALMDLLKPQNKEVLVKILTYHVIPGKVMSGDLKAGPVTSVQGDPINVKINSGRDVFVNDGQVIKGDIPASNGVIHVIDNVILPPSL
ncbi:fasciclin domain-containing protein [Okeanomitos corallinicola TIOX110]|uniref:Fasciclin domain-containing protein n=1 Tax=Okeanomitos corallinicola TIOX110 TaxID=3133117 RepID=A0ABZ2V1L1_9CYAN